MINSLAMGFSFLGLYTISKTRTGSAVAIKDIVGKLHFSHLILILFIALFAGIFAFFISKFVAKFFAKNISRINYSKISVAVLIFVSLVVLFLSEILGFFIFIVSTLTGVYCISLNVRRTNIMGCLLLPTIILLVS